jgi:hypothetical protein
MKNVNKIRNAAKAWQKDSKNPKCIGLAYINDFIAGVLSPEAEAYHTDGRYTLTDILDFGE